MTLGSDIKAACINGHLYTPENIRKLRDGSYQCKECDAARHERNRITLVDSGLQGLADELDLAPRDALRRLVALRRFLVLIYRRPDPENDWYAYSAADVRSWLAWHGLMPVLVPQDAPIEELLSKKVIPQ